MGKFRVPYRHSFVMVGFVLCCLQLAVAQHPAFAVGGASPRRSKHTKSVDDLDAIGTRNVSGQRIGNWYSLDREIKLGHEYSDQIDSETKSLQDSFITEYVNRIVQNLVRNSDAKVPFVIKVIDSEEINAFALPGGFLYVNSGLLLAAEDEAEFAAVMAHEIAHVAARHATRQMTRIHILDLTSIPLVAFGGNIGGAAREAVVSLTAMKFSRTYEAEADYLGVEYAYKAGYDPRALISFLERLTLLENQNPGAVSKAFSTHPPTADRVRKMLQEIEHLLPARAASIVSTSDFDELHSRLVLRTGQNSNHMPRRPTLRRRDTRESNEDTPSNLGPGPDRP
jgi:predicted Zn-dependent protease